MVFTLHMAPYLIKEPEPGNSIFKKMYCTNEIGELAIELNILELEIYTELYCASGHNPHVHVSFFSSIAQTQSVRQIF